MWLKKISEVIEQPEKWRKRGVQRASNQLPMVALIFLLSGDLPPPLLSRGYSQKDMG